MNNKKGASVANELLIARKGNAEELNFNVSQLHFKIIMPTKEEKQNWKNARKRSGRNLTNWAVSVSGTLTRAKNKKSTNLKVDEARAKSESCIDLTAATGLGDDQDLATPRDSGFDDTYLTNTQ